MTVVVSWYNDCQRPRLTVQEFLPQAKALLGQPLREWHQATAGADHLVVVATTESGQTVVLKAGTEADIDADILQRLQGTGVPVPRLLAHASLGSQHQNSSLAIMTFVEGTLLADVAAPHRYLPPLVTELRKVHAVTTTGKAGEVGRTTGISWKDYLLGIPTGEHPEFRWAEIAESPWVDAAVLDHARGVVIERVEALPDLPRLSLLHGDLNPYNVFVQGHRITGIIDWSYARFGDPLFDLARLRMNPFIRCHPEATDTYFSLLELSPDERLREETYYLFNLLEYVNWYVLDQSPERVRDHIRLLAQLVSAR